MHSYEVARAVGKSLCLEAEESKDIQITSNKWYNLPNIRLCISFFVHKRIILVVKRVEFVSDKNIIHNIMGSMV
jgi:hypothetical protein